MPHDHSHDDLLEELAAHFQPVLEESRDGVYLWLGPGEMVCNERMADLLGYSVDELCAQEDFLGTFVDAKDQEAFGRHYSEAIGDLQGPVRFRFTGVRKDGRKVALETDMVPVTFGGHAVAYHFVRPAT